MPNAIWPIPPGNPGSIAIPHRVDKQAVVLRCDADPAFRTGQEILDAFPWVIAEGIASSHHQGRLIVP